MEKDIIAFTPAAEQKLQELKTGQTNPAESYVRIGSRGGGCGVAVTYYIGFDKMEPDDQVFQFGKVECVIKKGQLLQLQGLNVNWLETDTQQGFEFSLVATA